MKQVSINSAEETQSQHTTQTENKQNENGLAYMLAFFALIALFFIVFL